LHEWGRGGIAACRAGGFASTGRTIPSPELLTRYRFDLAVEKAGLKRPRACRRGDTARAPDDACSTCGGSGVDKLKFHDLRHQAATDLIARDATFDDVRDFLRHKTLAMTLRYRHLLDDRRANTAVLLDPPAPEGQEAAGEPKAGGGDRESR